MLIREAMRLRERSAACLQPRPGRKGPRPKEKFRTVEERLLEDSHQLALPHIPKNQSVVWRSFPHSVHPFTNVKSRVNYLVRRDSPLAQRSPLDLRYFSYPELAKRLKELGHCEVVHRAKEAMRFGRARAAKGSPFLVTVGIYHEVRWLRSSTSWSSHEHRSNLLPRGLNALLVLPCGEVTLQ